MDSESSSDSHRQSVAYLKSWCTMGMGYPTLRPYRSEPDFLLPYLYGPCTPQQAGYQQGIACPFQDEWAGHVLARHPGQVEGEAVSKDRWIRSLENVESNDHGHEKTNQSECPDCPHRQVLSIH